LCRGRRAAGRAARTRPDGVPVGRGGTLLRPGDGPRAVDLLTGATRQRLVRPGRPRPAGLRPGLRSGVPRRGARPAVRYTAPGMGDAGRVRRVADGLVAARHADSPADDAAGPEGTVRRP